MSGSDQAGCNDKCEGSTPKGINIPFPNPLVITSSMASSSSSTRESAMRTVPE